MYQVRAQAQAPERLRVQAANAAGAAEPLDFTTVTVAAIEATTPGGETRQWSTAITAQSTTGLTLEHVFAVGDVWDPGVYRINVVLTVPGGVRRAGPSVLNVVP